MLSPRTFCRFGLRQRYGYLSVDHSPRSVKSGIGERPEALNDAYDGVVRLKFERARYGFAHTALTRERVGIC